MSLLDARGNPLTYKADPKKQEKVTAPRIGNAFGQWAGKDDSFVSLPGGAVMQFDLSRLTLADYRAMRQHYQLGSSLNVLSFVMHQIDWEIECDDAEIKEMIEDDLKDNWTPLIRAISQSFWAGYSPIAVNYKNAEGYTKLDKIKDLVPEECRVEFEKIEGWAPANHPKPTLWKYNGFRQNGYWIPPENTLWYPLLSENADFYGRKLLRPAFPAWFFSNLIHLFANRYFERFGEPLPVGRGRFGDEVDMGDGTTVNGKRAMENIVTGIRNRAVVVLPSDRDPQTKEYDYDIEYLESQMRGADFERYLSRLDEEMSLAVFTPILLFRTADVGSYNLGQAHLKIFQQMLNAVAGDMQYYLQNFLVTRLLALNFPQFKGKCKWVYRKQGQGDTETYKELMSELVRRGVAKPDLSELGAIVGLTFTEVEQLTAPPPEPTQDPNADPNAPPPTVKAGKSVLDEAVVRVAREVGSGKVQTTLGYRNRFTEALVRDGFSEAEAKKKADALYEKLNRFIVNAAPVADSADDMKNMLQQTVDAEIAA